MTSTPSLVLKLDTNDLILSLRDDVNHVAELLYDLEIRREDDLEIGRSYLRLVGHGVELSFKDNKLSSVFLYVSEGPENCGTFRGETDLLTREVFTSKDDKVFCDALEAQGFVLAKKKYPFSVDYLNDELRVRLECRHGSIIVLIDDGEMVR